MSSGVACFLLAPNHYQTKVMSALTGALGWPPVKNLLTLCGKTQNEIGRKVSSRISVLKFMIFVVCSELCYREVFGKETYSYEHKRAVLLSTKVSTLSPLVETKELTDAQLS